MHTNLYERDYGSPAILMPVIYWSKCDGPKQKFSWQKSYSKKPINLLAKQPGRPLKLVAHPWKRAPGEWQQNSLLQQEKPHEALKLLDNAWQALILGGDELETSRTHALTMIIAAQLGRDPLVETHFQAACEIFERLGARRDLEQLQAARQSFIHR